MSVPVFSVNAACPLTVNSSGGNGGNSTSGSNHAGGGAGGQGVVVYSIPQPTTNITTITNNGVPGCNLSPCTASAGVAGGTNSVGIVVNAIGVLPIELISFDAKNNELNQVELKWATASEKNTHYFLVERSIDGINWITVDKVMANGTTNIAHQYSGTDLNPPSGVVYYRLTSVDFDLSRQFSPLVAIEIKREAASVVIYPNPAKNQVTIALSDIGGSFTIGLFDALGRSFNTPVLEVLDSKLILDISSLKSGMYYVSIEFGKYRKGARLIVE